MKKCWSCKSEKPLSSFRKDASRKDGLDHACSKCVDARKELQKRESGYYKNDKYKAKRSVSSAVKKGLLKKLPCENCGDMKSFAHHHMGYSLENWLNIIWLCGLHHRIIHGGVR